MQNADIYFRTVEIASITANIDALKADLKTIDKEIARIEAKKVKAETKATEVAKKAGWSRRNERCSRYDGRWDPRKAEINILEPCGSVGA